ncbi:major capsid protein, partial [Xenorhabdus beddingii]|uniref:major capsid protein n=1 Tax=Xenorhabdus beddingii TaxID=40578 RepID=UPI000A3294B4
MLVFSKSIGEKTGNLAVNQFQFRELETARNASAQAAADFIWRTRGVSEDLRRLDAANAVQDIRLLYKSFDQTVIKQFEPNTEFNLLNDLMPLSRSVRLEESVYEYARTGGKGWAHTSMSGQIGAALDARAYSFDGTMVPIHDSGFKFEWRDPIFNKGSALASLADAQQGSVDSVRRQYVDFVFNGFRDSEGNFIKFDDKTWKGLRSDERVAQVALNIDFATSTDGQAMRSEAIRVRDVLKLQNYQYGEQTWYVSGDILSNWEELYFNVNQTRTVLDEIKKITGISSIKEDFELKGNEILVVPLRAGV